MSRKIIIDPVTRISGFLEIQLIVENGIVIDALTGGMLFRGFESMLVGRVPEDAIYFTERICGICSSSHAIASSLALQQAYGIVIAENHMLIRDLLHGFELLQNHIKQFYLFTVPDFVRLDAPSPFTPQANSDFRLGNASTDRIGKNHAKAVEHSMLAHEGVAILGGKAPHIHGITAGGCTVDLDSVKLPRLRSILAELKKFVHESMLEDCSIISNAYRDYFQVGESYKNYISYGLFSNSLSKDLQYVSPSVMINGKLQPFDQSKIMEDATHAWYSQTIQENSNSTQLEVNSYKSQAYSFIKAPRYDGHPMEGGPLARMKLAGLYKNGDSCMDRIVARVQETRLIVSLMERMLDRLEIGRNTPTEYAQIAEAFGAGLTDTVRGALGHWLEVRQGTIHRYVIITPTGWNFSPRDSHGVLGPAEQALIGIRTDGQPDDPSAGRIIRSMDPCISCGTH